MMLARTDWFLLGQFRGFGAPVRPGPETRLSFFPPWENLSATPMKTVLLIDDDRGSLLILSWAFKKAGWKVLEAEDGEVGLVLFGQHQPDLIVCDLMMPRCNGFQVCRQIRGREDDLRATKIIISTASSYATDRKNAFDAGADEYLTKPIDPDELLLLVNRYEKRPATPAELPAATRPDAGASAEPPPAPASISASEERPARVKFWGVRGSIPTPGPLTAYYGGNTSCVEVEADGEIIVLDAGTGIRPLGLDLVSRYANQPMDITVLITHTHWDHIQGFPFFVPAYNPKNKVRVLGYEGARRGLEGTLSSQMESPYFPISMQQMPANISIQELKDLQFNVGKVQVQAQFMNHPGICVGYRVNTSQGSVAFVPDNEPFLRLKSETPGQTEKEAAAALEYARRQDEKLIEFLRDVDVLIIDAQYDAEEYVTHAGWGHSCVDDAVAFAISANVKKLFLFHHDPGHDDERVATMAAHGRALAHRQGSKLEVEAAREGCECMLRPAPAPEPTEVVEFTLA